MARRERRFYRGRLPGACAGPGVFDLDRIAGLGTEKCPTPDIAITEVIGSIAVVVPLTARGAVWLHEDADGAYLPYKQALYCLAAADAAGLVVPYWYRN